MLRWLIRLVWTLMVFVVLAVGALFLMPVDRIAQIAADQIRSFTGREVTISGDVSMTVWPVLGASIGKLTVANAPWSNQGPMLEARDASVAIDAMALFGGDIRIRHVKATSPVVRVETRKDGRASWDFSDGSTAAAPSQEGTSSLPPEFALDSFKVTNATLVYAAEGSETLTYSGTDLTVQLPDSGGPIQVSASVRPAGVPVSLDLTVGKFADFIGGSVQDIDVSVRAADSTVGLKGRASLSGDVAGQLDVQTPDTDALLAAFGLDALDLPDGLGNRITMSTNLTFTDATKVTLRGMSADLGKGNTVTGDLDLALNDTPQVTANFTAGALDLTALSPEDTETVEDTSSGWSTETIDASGLSAFNGQIGLNADSIDLGMMKLGKTRTVLRNDRARMVFELREVRAYDGTLAGEFVVNNRNGLSVGGKLNSAGLQVKGLLSDFADVTDISGAATADLQFLGVGESLDQIMRSLRGQGAVRLAGGRIQGFNLDQLMRSGKLQGGTTVFDDLTASFTMDQGNVVNTDLFANLQDFEARGEGRIGLGAQDINYLFTPKALRLNKAKGGLAIPVRIQGPWADPSIKPDLKAALDLDLDAEKERLERKLKEEAARKEQELKAKLQAEENALKAKLDRERQEAEARLRAREAEAKRKLQEQAAQKLNLQTQAGQSVEDKLKTEIGNGLKKLFD